jgi:7-cyano-7-deazaguanine tRNA-ribosyltransferase
MMFEVIDIDGFGRIGKLNINNKEILTPTILPVIHPYNNEMSIGLIQKLGAEIIFTNSYILYQNKTKREEALSKGLHNFLGFNGIIATDSGAFQQYMYNKEHLEIQPEIIERFQEEIGSDLPVILDVPVQLDDNFSAARNKVSKTILRAKDNIRRRKSEKCNWIGPIHGGSYHSLLKKSAIELSKLDFPILAIGGLVKAYMNYQFDLAIDILLTVKKYVDQAKPIHMFGLGLPQFFSLAVACGCDLMDSAAYYLYAKENRYFSLSTGTKRLEELQEFPCNCPICSSFTPKEVLNEKERSRVSLIAQHNLHITFSELKTIRQAMYEGNLWELVETRIRNHPSLLKAYNVIKQHRKDIEINEKVYKEHGRLFASYDSFNRPLFYRHQQKLNNNYRTPKNTTSLLIIPELDVSADNSPTINEWINTIRNNGIFCLIYSL